MGGLERGHNHSSEYDITLILIIIVTPCDLVESFVKMLVEPFFFRVEEERVGLNSLVIQAHN